MTDKYEHETKVRNLAISYINDRKESTLNELYHALIFLAERLYLKYVKRAGQNDWDEDIIHDACAICVENLQKGTVDADSGWSRYIIQVLSNRSKYTNPMHSSYSRWKRGKASQRAKEKMMLPTTNVTFSSCTDIRTIYLNIDNVGCTAELHESDEIICSFVQNYIKEMSTFLPFKDKAASNLFIYHAVMSLFEISMNSTVYHSKSGFPKRYRFLVSQARVKFKQLVREHIG